MKKSFVGELSRSGIRLTPLRETLGRLFERSTSPLSISEILRELRGIRFEVNKTSVYRNLELFIRLHLVTKVQLSDEKQYFERVRNHEHHHHLVCIDCHSIDEVEVSDERLVASTTTKAKAKGFEIRRHTFEFHGLCRQCQVSV